MKRLARAGGFIAIVVMSSGCGLLAPDPIEAPPPDVLANGVAGTVITYCRTVAYCSDGGVDVESGAYPGVDRPIILTFDEPPGRVTVWVMAPDRAVSSVEVMGVDADGAVESGTLTIERLPPGEWEILRVDVGFPGEVSSSAAWRLDDPG